ncbi:hypothetical protein [Actinomadura nitritigenes]|uniref:hypothetical protein n=1 Tax=Actinomadura nitritigenes TaxID=134602 RepID=UPI003D930E65
MTDHFREAERLIEQAETWMDADRGWMASMSTRERVDRRAADFLGAIAHGVAGVLEALNARPLEDPSAVRVPLLDLPARDGRREATL